MEIINFINLSANDQKLLFAAREAREFAYAPYSGFKVGASVLDENGAIFSGCNIESADYTLTTHAEMCAIDKMVSSGSRVLHKVAIVFEEVEKPVVPCGLCRQKMTEFAGKEVVVIGASIDHNGNFSKCYRFGLDELIPFTFNSNYFKS